MKYSAIVVLLFATVVALCVRADTPANCMYEQIRGNWVFYLGDNGHDNTVDCTNFDPSSKLFIELVYPDLAFDEDGNKGFWTMIYNQGFEVVLNGQKYFAFSKYTTDPQGNVTSVCDETMNGWYHDAVETPKNWGCYYGKRMSSLQEKIVSRRATEETPKPTYVTKKDPAFVGRINQIQKSWKAGDCMCCVFLSFPFMFMFNGFVSLMIVVFVV
jgi:cathepsin C